MASRVSIALGIHGFWMNVPSASAGGAGAATDRTVRMRGRGAPRKGRFPLASMAARTRRPGGTVTSEAAKRQRRAFSASVAERDISSGTFPRFSATTVNLARRPAVTDCGSRLRPAS